MSHILISGLKHWAFREKFFLQILSLLTASLPRFLEAYPINSNILNRPHETQFTMGVKDVLKRKEGVIVGQDVYDLCMDSMQLQQL